AEIGHELMADDSKPQIPSAPPTGANPAATPHQKPVPPGASEAATAAAAAATGAQPARPAAPKPAVAPASDLAGKTTTVASLGGAAAAKTASASTPAAKPAAATPGRDPDDTSPLLTRRAWIGLAWGAFSAASAAALAATGRFMFPNVLNEPAQQFKAGFPNEYGMGVDDGRKAKFGIGIGRTPSGRHEH